MLRSSLRALRSLLGLSLRADPRRTAAMFASLILGDVIVPASAYGMKVVADGVADADRGRVVGGLVAVGLARLISFGVSWTGFTLRMGLRERVGRVLDGRLIALASEIPGIEHYERPDYQDELQLLRWQRGMLATLPDALATNVGLVLRSVSTVGLLAVIHPILVLLPLLGVPSLIAGAWAERRREAAREATIQRRRFLGQYFSGATVAVAGKEVRIFGLQDVLRDRHETLRAEVDAHEDAVEAKVTVVSTVAWLCFAAGFGAAIAVVAGEAVAGRATPGDLLLTFTLAAMVNGQVAGAAGLVAWFLRSLKIGQRYLWLVDYAADAVAAAKPAEPAPLPMKLTDGIRFEDVSFAYPATDEAVLGDVNLHLPAGSTVAIVGDNGAGKSTLVKLLCRFYEPATGRILVDGVPLDRFDPVDWRSVLAAGFQDFAKFELLASEVVGVGDLPRLDDEEAVRGALDRASASDVIDDLDRGLATQLGRSFEGGAELSGGQWQKLALGRALMRELPLLLVLDEPTSALDAPTEHALFERYAGAAQRAARSNGAITVLVSHRFSTVRMADLIIVVEGGRIAEVGSHQELVALAGLYAELYELQAASYR